MPDSFDWSHLQSFVAVARHGSLSSAARSIGASQPTLGRHIAALEDRLGVKLFARTATGLEITPTGVELFEHAEAMAGAADRLALAADGRANALRGTVRITASEIMATYALPDILTALHEEEPEIEIEVVASNRTENLIQREADIAIRMYRPTQADVFTRRMADLPIGLYGAKSYIARRGAPETMTDLMDHTVVGYDRDDQIIRGFRQAGVDVDRHFFAFRSDDQVVAWRMVVAGFGLGFNQRTIGDAEPALIRLWPDVELPPMQVWLTAHAELKTSARVRRVFDFLAVRLAA